MLKKLFGFNTSRHSVRIEVMAGVTTFLAMSYIMAVNPGIFSALESQGMDNGAVFTATALAAIIGTLVMSIYAKKPFGLAPGMGLNTFFVYTVCLTMGYTWQFALTAVLIEGVIFIILTLTKMRMLIVKSIPESLKDAISVGIGLYIAFIGLCNSGIVASDAATDVTLGDLSAPSTILAIIGFFITSVLLVFRIKGAILLGIIITTIIGIPMGLVQVNGVVSTPPSVAPLFCQFEWDKIFTADMVIVVFTFLFLDLFDTIGTVVGLSVKTGMIDKDGNVEDIDKIFMADAVATTAGACVGANTTTTYLESATGVAEGGRTGLTSFTIAVCFILSLFLAPLFLAVPAAATGPVLVIVGGMMLSPIKNIDLDDYSEGILAFVTMLLMPFAYSISDGIMFGIISYSVINAFTGKLDKISPMVWVLTLLFIGRYVIKYAIQQ